MRKQSKAVPMFDFMQEEQPVRSHKRPRVVTTTPEVQNPVRSQSKSHSRARSIITPRSIDISTYNWPTIKESQEMEVSRKPLSGASFLKWMDEHRDEGRSESWHDRWGLYWYPTYFPPTSFRPRDRILHLLTFVSPTELQGICILYRIKADEDTRKKIILHPFTRDESDDVCPHCLSIMHHYLANNKYYIHPK